jgi:hypothetical protein
VIVVPCERVVVGACIDNSATRTKVFAGSLVGGMAVVLKALVEVPVDAALKTAEYTRARDLCKTASQRRVLAEQRFLETLRHPRILSSHGVSTVVVDGRHCLCMVLNRMGTTSKDGASLLNLRHLLQLEGRTLPLRCRVRLALQVAEVRAAFATDCDASWKCAIVL